MKLLSKLSTTIYPIALIVVIALSLQSCLNGKNEYSMSSIDFATYTNMLGTPIFVLDNGKSITAINEGADKLTDGTTLEYNERVLIITSEINQESFIGENEIHAKVSVARKVKNGYIENTNNDYTIEYLKKNSQPTFSGYYQSMFVKSLNSKNFNLVVRGLKVKGQDNPMVHLEYNDDSYSIDNSSLTLYLLVDKLPEDGKFETVTFEECITFPAEELQHKYDNLKKINIKYVDSDRIKTQVYNKIGEDEFNWYEVNNSGYN